MQYKTVLKADMHKVYAKHNESLIKLGSEGSEVKTLQKELNIISNFFPAIKKTKIDGIFSQATEENVNRFQTIFDLQQTGSLDHKTKMKVSEIYSASIKMGEMI